ncbi:hypothetical protein [Actinocorallia populi]|uniref:hypothetical protein n=1 Tax=Actinocorallia populi TaxID=2079200 RepID=UPI000D08F307|nr:hypothetical protein [Actinocorallia populi]
MLVCSLALVAGCSAGKAENDAPQGAADVPQSTPAVADPGSTLAQATFDGPKGEFGLAVVSLTARGRLANLTLTLTPSYPGKDSVLAFIYFGGEPPEVSLVDPVGLKRYLVVKDSAGNALGSGNENYNVGRPNTLNYTFAAPPEDVATVDVQFDDYPPFRNVPISR